MRPRKPAPTTVGGSKDRYRARRRPRANFDGARRMPLDAHTLRAIAVAASCDPRTVRRFVEGKHVRPMVAERIRKAMRDPEREDVFVKRALAVIEEHARKGEKR